MAVNASWKEAQRAVIGALLINPGLTAGEIFLRAKPEYFDDASLRHVFEAARDLWHDGRPLDAVSIQHRAGDDYVRLLADCMSMTPTAFNYSGWLDILQSCARVSALQAEAIKILASDVTEDSALAAYERMGEMLRGTGSAEHMSLAQLIGDYLDRMHDPKPPDYLNWGIEKLDRVINVSPGMFVILAADSSVGKTALALQFGIHFAMAGRRVGFISIETVKESLEDRIMAETQVAGIPLPVTKQKKLTDAHFDAAGKAGMLADNIPFFVDRHVTTLQGIRSMVLMNRYDVVFIDYIQLIEVPGRERWEIVTDISMGLHRMAQQLGVTIVGLSQITPPQKSRTGKAPRPSKDDLRESRQLKQDADVIMILSPSADDEDPADTRLLEVVKNKDGRCGAVKLRFDMQQMTFTQLVTMSQLNHEGNAAKNKRLAKAEAGDADGNIARAAPDQVRLQELQGDNEELPF